ncbi:hypothetical protein MNBD_NITROSPINAE02-492 [hydrothermal vent metagenome]|uniref:VWFA domain-containing protein n=1 Tax=hydrothermal vent metagenome TaxID=652676 RepID=A0A3B1CAQ3_9ZZZZ
MIIHRYSQWEEPEKPPFTLEEVIRAASDIMLRYHVDFNEALRHMISQGLSINQFLRDEQMDNILDSYIDRVKRMKDDLHDTYNLEDDLRARRRSLASLTSEARGQLDNNDDIDKAMRQAARNRSLADFYVVKWRIRNDDRLKDNRKLAEYLERAAILAEFLERGEAFDNKYGKRFHGEKPPGDGEVSKALFGKYLAMEELEAQLVEARERGNLFGVDDEKLRAVMGEEEYQKFTRAREEMMERLKEAFEETGQVEEEDGIFKLTPAAARKVGERALRIVFSEIKMDGFGAHVAQKEGDGIVEKQSSRPYEYGDSITHLDLPASMINSLIREGTGFPIKLKTEDMEVHPTHGAAKTSVVVMIDMSGSMSRFGRFYNAKKVALALDAITRAHYPEDSLNFVGFATFARRIVVGEILGLAPEPITFMGGGVNMRVDLTRIEDNKKELPHVPRYFTNMQKGLAISRRILTSEPGTNKEIILITDGAPTAYHEGQYLHLNYPPQESGYKATLREVRALTDDKITINTFLLGSDWDTGYFGEAEFIQRMLNINRGRLFHPAPDSLTQYVLTDYVANKKKLIDF